MSSATERATEIWTKLCWDLKEWEDIDGTKDWSGRFVKNKLINFIAAEIEAAQKEIINCECNCQYDKGFRAAQERAVEISKNYKCCDCASCDGEHIAARIKELRL